MRLFEQADADRAIVGLRSEQFDLHRFGVHPRRGDDAERRILPPAPAVENTRGDFLADSRRAGDEDAASRARDAFQRRAHIVDGGAGPRQFVRRARFFAQLLIFEFQPLILGRARDEVEQALGLERLFDEVERAAADGGHGRVEPAMAGNDDDRQRRVEILDRLDQPQPVEPRSLQPDVDQRQRGAPLTDRLQRGVAVGRRARLIAFVFHDSGDQLANVALVVDDQNIKRHILLYPAGSESAPEPIRHALLSSLRPSRRAAAAGRDAASA